jgi:CHRD domain-containing protein
MEEDLYMQTAKQSSRRSLWALVSVLSVLLAGFSATASSDEIRATLSGSQEVPPVTTSATGTGTIAVGADRSVSGQVTVSGMSVTVAHIHEAPPDKNGPIVIPLIRTAENVWSVPEGVILTDSQYEAYKAGNLYFNFHSATYRAGEIRGQIKP